MKNPNRKILFIAGLNNNDETFQALMQEFAPHGVECLFLNLPGQGAFRDETESVERARDVFAKKMNELPLEQYGVVAFSTGALYFNLWLHENQEKKPLFQLLLSPALRIRRKDFLGGLFSLLPAGFSIKSLAPRKFRRYHWMRVSEYRLLFQLVDELERRGIHLPPEAKIIIDPRDELVDAQAIQELYPQQTQLWARETGKITPGMFHALFHPDFWGKEDWKKFVGELKKVALG